MDSPGEIFSGGAKILAFAGNLETRFWVGRNGKTLLPMFPVLFPENNQDVVFPLRRASDKSHRELRFDSSVPRERGNLWRRRLVHRAAGGVAEAGLGPGLSFVRDVDRRKVGRAAARGPVLLAPRAALRLCKGGGGPRIL